MKHLRKNIAVLLSFCVLLCGLSVNLFASAAGEVNVQFNAMDTHARQDMEPSGDTTVKDLSTCTTDYLEGSGAVKFGYKADRTDLVWYGRVPNDLNSTGVNIAGATHVIFDMYVSDVSKWTLAEPCTFNLRSLSSQATGAWDTSCGQVKSADLYAAFSNLKNGWNQVVLPIDSSVATETVLWGFQIRFSKGTAKAGFYTMIDDIRFVNQAYLDSTAYQNATADKYVTRVKALMAAIPGITNVAEQRRMKVAANITYHSLDATRKSQANSSGVPYDGEDWTDGGVPDSHLAARKTVNEGDYAFSLAVLNDLHYAVRNNAAWQDVYLNSMNWIVNNSKKENIKMAIQLGDLTSNVDYNDGRNETAEWDAVRGGFDILRKANLPFATVVGNHDRVYSYTNYHTYFPYAEQAQSPYFGGAMEEGRTENLYYTFQVSGMKYMVLTLDVYPDAAQLAWADGVIKAHPYHNVIVVTHSYLKSQNTYEIVYTTEHEDASYLGENVWNSIIKNNPNVIMTLNAHNEYPQGKAGLGLLQGTNNAGKPVYQFLVGDPQVYDRDHGGLGSVVMIRFSEDGKKVSLEYISTRYDKQFVGFTNESSLHTTNYYEVAVDPVVDAYTEYTESLTPRFHLGLSTATEADENWPLYHYVGQPFVPDETVLHGVNVPLAMTSQEATLHFEIRSELNGTALASNDVKITGKNGEMKWYTLLLKNPLNVNPHQRYYVVYYLTQRSSHGACVVYGTEHEQPAGMPTSLWQMLSGGSPNFTAWKTLSVGFDVIDGTDMNQPAIDAVIAQINALPSKITLEDKEEVVAARVAYDALAYYQQAAVAESALTKLAEAEATLNNLKDIPSDIQTYETVYMINDFSSAIAGTNSALSSDRAISGTTSLKMSAAAEETAAAWETSMDPAVDLTRGGKYQKEDLGLAFWLYVDGETSVAHMFQLCSVAEGWTNGIQWTKWTADMVGSDPKQWAYVVIPFGSDATSFDLTNLQSYRIQQMNSEEAHTYYIDDLQVVYIPDYDTAMEVENLIQSLPSEITLEDKAQVEAAREAYDALTDDQKDLVSEDALAKLIAAEQVIADLEEDDDQSAADKAAADRVIQLIDALPREITLEDKARVEAAREAYDALTNVQKDLVTNLQKLTDAEAALAALEQPPVEPDLLYGDADGNGTVDAADALKALQHAVKLIVLEGDSYTVADVDGNQSVDATDALLMLQYTVKLIDSFPVEKA